MDWADRFCPQYNHTNAVSMWLQCIYNYNSCSYRTHMCCVWVLVFDALQTKINFFVFFFLSSNHHHRSRPLCMCVCGFCCHLFSCIVYVPRCSGRNSFTMHIELVIRLRFPVLFYCTVVFPASLWAHFFLASNCWELF